MTTGPAEPEIAVVVPSHDRPLRLRWLLNALEEQTLPRERWEVIVGHDSSGPETAELLSQHPLASDGTLRHVALPPGSAPPGANRNAAVLRTKAPVVAFTDDDCRPPPEWLERALAAARRHPGAIVQGRTVADPHEEHLLGLPHARTQHVEPPGPFAQACNIVYPRDLLDHLGGFDETMFAGEDADLAFRAAEGGATYVGAPEVLTYHAVDVPTILGRLRSLPRWADIPKLVKRHPRHREAFVLRFFWRPSHLWLFVALAGLALGRRSRWAPLFAAPWVLQALPHRGSDIPSRLWAMSELPGRAAVDITEMAVLLRGSARHRTLLL